MTLTVLLTASALTRSLNWLLTLSFRAGTQRRVQKKTPHNAQAAVSEDKKLKAAIKKFGKWWFVTDEMAHGLSGLLMGLFVWDRRAAV